MNFSKIFFYCLLLASFAIGVSSCKEEDDDEIVGNAGKLEGEWTSMSYGFDLSISKDGRIKMLTYSDEEVATAPDHAIGIIQKASNNRLSVYTSSGVASGTYSFDTTITVKGNRLKGMQIMELDCSKLTEGGISASGKYMRASDNNSIDLPVYSDILGTWENQFKGDKYVFNSDGTGYLKYTTDKFDWVVYKGTLYLHKTGSYSYETASFSISGNDITITRNGTTVSMTKNLIVGNPGDMQGVWLKTNDGNAEEKLYSYNNYYYGFYINKNGELWVSNQKKTSKTLLMPSNPQMIITSVMDDAFTGVDVNGDVSGTLKFSVDFWLNEDFVFEKNLLMTVSFSEPFSLSSSFNLSANGTYMQTENADGTDYDHNAQDSELVKSWKRYVGDEPDVLSLKSDGTGYLLGYDDSFVQYLWAVAYGNILLFDKTTSNYEIFKYTLEDGVLTIHATDGDRVYEQQ